VSPRCPVCLQPLGATDATTRVQVAGMQLFSVHAGACAQQTRDYGGRLAGAAFAAGRRALRVRYPRVAVALEAVAAVRRRRLGDGQSER